MLERGRGLDLLAGGNLLKSFLNRGGKRMIHRVFFHAGPGAIPALNTFGLVNADAVDPFFAVEFLRGVGLIQKNGGTVSTARALVEIDEPGLFSDLDFEVSLVSFDGLNGGEGMDFNIDVPADLDQFRGDDSHGTIVGGEGLV